MLRTKENAKRFLDLVFGDRVNCIDDLDATLQQLVDGKPSTVRVSKLSQYHHKAGKVVLAGDSAHTMSSGMGLVCRPRIRFHYSSSFKGMTCGLDDIVALVDILRKNQWKDFATSLQEYSDARVPENNAAIELNYVPLIQSHPLLRLTEKMWSLLGVPLLFSQTPDPTVKLTSIYQRCF